MYTPAVINLRELAQNQDNYDAMVTYLDFSEDREALDLRMKFALSDPSFFTIDVGDVALAGLAVCRKRGWDEHGLPGKEHV